MPRPSVSDDGGMSPLIHTRADRAVKAHVVRRAAAETDNNISEIARRLIIYALPRMPVGFDPYSTTPTTEEQP
jgi:hypothetical protein